MPMSSWFIKVARIAPILSLGLGLLVVAGCGPPEAGSVKLPADFKRSGPMGYGPAASKGTSSGLAPGQFRPEPRPAAAKARRTTRGPTGR
jgi:hypothetical protein